MPSLAPVPPPSTGVDDSENLYHILLISSHLSKDPNNETEKIRILGTYTSLKVAKAAAHSSLFDAGYESEWFVEYKTKPEELDNRKGPYRTPGLTVVAVSPDGTTFRVHVLTTPNPANWKVEAENGRITTSGLYYVVQTTFEYEDSDEKDISIEGVFTTYKEARDLASSVLLSEEDGIQKDSFAQYDEAKGSEVDCGFGENVIVHAVGVNGENYLVSVLPRQDLETIRVEEAARRAA